MELNISPIQVIGVFIASLAISKLVADFRARKESRIMFTFWFCLWITVVTFVLYPDLTIYIKNWLLGPQQSVGTITGIGLVFLLFLIYRIYVKSERVERLLREHATKLAIKDLEKIYSSQKHQSP